MEGVGGVPGGGGGVPPMTSRGSSTPRLVRGIPPPEGGAATATHVAPTHRTEIFFAPKCLAPCQPLRTVIPSVSLTTSSTPALVILCPSAALLPSSEACCPTDLWGHCTQLWSSSSEALLPNIGSVLGADFGCAPPGVACAPYLGTIIQ